MQRKIIKFFGNEFVRGGFIFTISSFLGSALNYFFNLLVARGLGPSGFGEVTATFSYLTISSVPMVVMTYVIIEKIGSKAGFQKTFALVLEEWFITKIKKWLLILSLPLVLTAPFLPRITNLSTVSSYFLIPLIIFSFVGSFYIAVLQGLKLFFLISLIALSSVVIKLLGAVFVILGVDGLFTIMFFFLLSSVALVYFPHFVLKKTTRQHKIAKSYKINKRLFHAVFNKQVIITFFSILAITSFNNMDIVFAKKFLSPVEAGIYSSWSLFAKIILYLIGPLLTVGYIFFYDKDSEKKHENLLAISIFLLLIAGFVSFIAYSYLSSFLIHLFFGSKFDSVKSFLPAASIFGSLYTIITFVNNYFLAKKSRFSLILAVVIPIYLILLFIIPKTINSIIYLNIYFSSFVTLVYLVAYGWRFFYNVTNGKEKR